jgi:hypothetical protein
MHATTTLCAYCGERLGDTDDHVPPKTIFPKPNAPHLLRVPACSICHGGTSDDDEYFRDTLVKHHRVADAPQAQAQVEKMLRAAANPKKTKYLGKTVASLTEVWVRTPAGIDLGTAPAIRVDLPRIARVLRRSVRGLSYLETGSRLASDIRVEPTIEANVPDRMIHEFARTFRTATPKMIEPGVFWYARGTPTDNDRVSAWLLVFFEAVTAFAITAPEDSPRWNDL